MKGIIFDIKRFAIHDGPGIRTTVFMKGCPLSCFWCHNPESRTSGIEYFDTGKLKEQVGKEISSLELMDEIKRDRVFYEHSGGGVSFSGGEPLLQPQFLATMLQKCKEEDIHSIVDTSAFCKMEVWKKIVELADHFLFDLKFIDPKKHRKYTGVDSASIANNLNYLDQSGKSYDLRIPLLPGFNDDEKELKAFTSLLSSLKNYGMIHLLPYHNTGMHKYAKFGLEKPLHRIVEGSEGALHRAIDYFKQCSLPVLVGG